MNNSDKTELFLNILEHKEFHENGKLEVHYYTLNGNIDGEYKRWHNNGQLELHTFFNNGELNGEYTEWDKDGNWLQADI